MIPLIPTTLLLCMEQVINLLNRKNQKEVVLEPIKPEVDKTPDGKEIEKETKKKK